MNTWVIKYPTSLPSAILSLNVADQATVAPFQQPAQLCGPNNTIKYSPKVKNREEAESNRQVGWVGREKGAGCRVQSSASHKDTQDAARPYQGHGAGSPEICWLATRGGPGTSLMPSRVLVYQKREAPVPLACCFPRCLNDNTLSFVLDDRRRLIPERSSDNLMRAVVSTGLEQMLPRLFILTFDMPSGEPTLDVFARYGRDATRFSGGTVYSGKLLQNGVEVSHIAVKTSDAIDTLLTEFALL
ncbi:hypothetical protein B0H13DRAFT_1865061 [Mycena leptocephala]|nr:hypothetical protein B0H13DRAFT_1865061 [Mycena leptocephala]